MGGEDVEGNVEGKGEIAGVHHQPPARVGTEGSERFRRRSLTRILQRAGQYALEGDLLFNTPDPALGGRKLIVIGDFGSSQLTVARAVGRLLERNQTKLYRLDEMDRLLELIRTAGEPVVPLDQTS